MDLTDIRSFCAALKGSWEDFPFDDTTLVIKTGKKMYCLAPTTGPLRINVKCDPHNAVSLREEYPFVVPGYHMSKRHWNTVLLDGDVPQELVYSWIEDSYKLVIASMSGKERREYGL